MGKGCVQGIVVFLVCAIFGVSQSSILKITDPNLNLLIHRLDALSPSFDMGNQDFPLTGTAIFAKGCNAVNSISDQTAHSIKIARNSSKLIIFVSQSDATCYALDHVLKCQKRDWCSGVVYHSNFFDPPGFEMWSLFDKHRPRSAYRVPMVGISTDNFNQWQELIEEANKKNYSHTITLTSDPNPWEKVFNSPVYLVYFQILTPIWSAGCLFLIALILSNRLSLNSLRQSSKHDSTNALQKSNSTFTTTNSQGRLTLKHICLSFHIFTHVSRLVLVIDPFQAKQILPFPVSSMFMTAVIAFEIASNMLLSFIVRELVQANKTIEMRKKIRYAYVFVLCFLIIDFGASAFQAARATTFPVFIIHALFYVGFDFVLGAWYFWQGFQFLKKHSVHEKVVKKQNPVRVRLTQIALVTSIAIMFIAVITLLMPFPSIFGTPWGYFGVLAGLYFVTQLASLFEIALFGGLALDLKKISGFLRKFGTSSKDDGALDI